MMARRDHSMLRWTIVIRLVRQKSERTKISFDTKVADCYPYASRRHVPYVRSYNCFYVTWHSESKYMGAYLNCFFVCSACST